MSPFNLQFHYAILSTTPGVCEKSKQNFFKPFNPIFNHRILVKGENRRPFLHFCHTQSKPERQGTLEIQGLSAVTNGRGEKKEQQK